MRPTTALLLLLLAPCAAASDIHGYELDPGSVQIGFDVERFGMRWISAHFRAFHGEVVIDRDPGDEDNHSSVDVIVQTDSIDSGDGLWNTHLRSADCLDTAHYPQMIFHSNRLRFDSDRAEAIGELTLHGITHAVVLSVTQLHCPRRVTAGDTCTFVARATVRRSDFGLPHGFWAGGDQVKITITAEGSPTGAP
jgi:polyisoprenoid-binding protein YceI